MLLSINVNHLTQECANCKQKRCLTLDSLVIYHLSIVPLPPCECGSQEFLNRTFDNPGAHAHLVNSLHWHLERKGQVREAVKDKLATETVKPVNKCELIEQNCSCVVNEGSEAPAEHQ